MKTNTDDKDEVIQANPQSDGAASVEYLGGSKDDDSFWLTLAQSNYITGKDYQESALTEQWEKNADHFNSRHFRRSAYNSQMSKGRSRIFRPLSRAAERSSSAQAAAAFFSNMEIVEVEPENKNNPEQEFSAKVVKKLVEYYLSKKIKWYLTVMGAWQDTRVYGPCCSYTDWRYAKKEVEEEIPVLNIHGKPSIDGRKVKSTKTKVLKDEPYINLIPPENLILDPACDWRDPINTSPYVVYLLPMPLVDVQTKMESGEWREYSAEDILSASKLTYDAVRQAREGSNRPDKHDVQERTEFKSIWVHYNFARINGEEYFYATLGTQYMLTDAKLLEDEYPVGVRPFTYGYSVIEAHKFSPSSPTEIISGLQTGVNDLANLRIDNIKLALNKRYILRRGAPIDLEALMRSVPGGGVFTDDVEKDIKVLDTRDVTGSSYREQERLETESNDITGSHMGSAVQNNRNLNQTVGGMEMLAEGQSALMDFDTRTFAESWVKPQLELLVQNIQMFAPDEAIQTLAIEGADKELSYFQRFEFTDDEDGMDRKRKMVDSIMSRALQDKMTITVNVGLGATSPQRKVQTLLGAVGAIVQLPSQGMNLDEDAIAKELFTASGYQDGKRFLKSEDPNGEQKITEEDLQAATEQGIQQGTDQVKMAQIEATNRIASEKIALDRELGFATLASKEGITMKELENKLQITIMKDQSHRDIEALRAKNTMRELNFKETTGKPGI
jgi:hypothetical protein